MRTIWKYLVSPEPIALTRPGTPVALAEDGNGNLAMWAEADPEANPVGSRAFCVLGTGWDIPEGFSHVDTTVTSSGYVWHLYVEDVS